MRLLPTLLLVLCFSFASAQDLEKKDTAKGNQTEITVTDSTTKTIKANDLVISVKGVKKMEDIDLENFNKNSFLDLLIASKKINKNIIC